MSEVAEKDPKESQVAINKLIRQINKALSSSIKFEPFANLFLALRFAHAQAYAQFAHIRV